MDDARVPEAKGTATVPAGAGSACRRKHRLTSARRLAAELQTASEVLPDLFIGSYGTAEDTALLDARGITHLVSLVGAVPAAARGRAVLQLEVSDRGESDLDEVLRSVAPFVDEARSVGGRVLVFCALGVNRSPAVVATYLQRVLGWPVERALGHLAAARGAVAIHDRYLAQLQRR